MKRRDFIRHPEAHGCRLAREGRSHSIYENTHTGQRAPVPRNEKYRSLSFVPFAGN